MAMMVCKMCERTMMVRTTVMLNLSEITPCMVATIRSVAMFVTIAHVVSLPTSCFRSYE